MPEGVEKARLLTEIRSLRGLLTILLCISVCSLALNGLRTYLVDTQLRKLQRENMQLRMKVEGLKQ